MHTKGRGGSGRLEHSGDVSQTRVWLAMGSWVGGRVGLRGGSLLALWADLREG
jgi:hypothetical protein